MGRQGDRPGRRAMQNQAAQGTAVDGASLSEAGEACAHLGALAVDLMAGQETYRRQHRRDRLAIELLRFDPGNEGGGAELVADIARRHSACVVEAGAAQERDRCGAQQGKGNGTTHEWLSLRGRPAEGDGQSGKPSERPGCFSPNSEPGWPNPKSAGRLRDRRPFSQVQTPIFAKRYAGFGLEGVIERAE